METVAKIIGLLALAVMFSGGVWVWSAFVFECYREKSKVGLVANFLILMLIVIASVATLCVMAWQMFAS